jgi:chemotaxis protein methyltransferase CheR
MTEAMLEHALTQRFGLRPRSSWSEDLPRALRGLFTSCGRGFGAGAAHDLVCADPNLLRELAGRLTVAETFFFRHREQLEAVIAHVRTVIGPGRPDPRVWSAGCSTGEEAYSISMMLSERLGPLAQSVQICACDINKQALSVARKALYGDWSLRGVGPELVLRHFIVEGRGRHRVRPEYRGTIDFQHLSILEMASRLEPGSVDVVLFRNVGVYLEPAANDACHAAFARVLRDNGLLVQAPTDPLPAKELFRRAEAAGTSVFSRRGHTIVPEPPRAPSPAILPRSVLRAPASVALPAVEPPAPPPPLVANDSGVGAALLSNESGARAALLGNDGRLGEALELVQSMLGANPSSAEAYLMRAQLELADARADAALEDLRRLLFIQPGHRIGRYWYSVVLRGIGRTEHAVAQLRELERRLALTDSDAILEDGKTSATDLLRAAAWLRASTE